MRAYGALSPTELIETPPDSVITFVMTGGSSAQAADWPNSTGGAAANAGLAGANLVHITAMSTAGAFLAVTFNFYSTAANTPASGTSVTTGTTAGSTGNSIPIFGSRYLQVPPPSTGFSVASMTSGYVMVEMWHK